MNRVSTRRCILVLTATFPRWLADTEPVFIFQLCRELTATGHRVTVLAPHTPGAKCHEFMDGIEVLRFRYAPEAWERLAYSGGIMANLKQSFLHYILLIPYLVVQYLALVRCLRKEHYDAVHAHWLVPHGVLLVAARWFAPGQTLFTSIAHGSDVNALRGRFWSWLRRKVMESSDCVVSVSETLRDQLVREGGAADRLAVIPMGIDLHRVFIPDCTPRAPAELLFVGRLVAGKGLDVLLAALPAILRKYPEVRLKVVGAGPERERLEAMAGELGLTSRVCFVGAVAHGMLPAYYRRATLLVLPSRAEGFGLVVVEALGCGCPVAASDLPALRSLLLDGRAGALFLPGDPAQLEEAVSRLLRDASYRSMLVEIGRQSIRERYDWRGIAQRYAEESLP